MQFFMKRNRSWRQLVFISVVLVGSGLAAVEMTTESLFAADAQTTFASPAEAAAALDNAAKNGDENSLAEILGVHTKALLFTGDEAEDKTTLQDFASKYQRMNRWVDMSDGSRVLYIGGDNFAFPVPLAQNAGGRWYFDSVAGDEEIRAREIGRNELLAIDDCYALATAEHLYLVQHDHSLGYAQSIVSTEGKQDGLYWPTSASQEPSPLASVEEFPKYAMGAFVAGKPFVLDGYAFRILSAQGDDAPGGAAKYAVNSQMTHGFAVLAKPVKYGETGVMSFMIGRDGVLYERDLGPDTDKIANLIQEFNPTEEWSPIE